MLTAYCVLFVSAFLAATLLPLSSEVLLFSLLSQGGHPALLVALATTGNTLGSMVNWWLGQYLLRFQHRRWFYFTPAQIRKAQARFQRYGTWSLLLAWLPVIGDALTLVAGIMRVPLGRFVILVGIGKLCRYIAVVFLADLWVL